MERLKVKAVDWLEKGVSITEPLIESARASMAYYQDQIELAKECGEPQAYIDYYELKVKAVKHLEKGASIIEALIEDARASVEFYQNQIEIAEEGGEPQAYIDYYKQELQLANEQVNRMLETHAEYTQAVIVARDAIISADETFKVFAGNLFDDEKQDTPQT